MLVKVLKKGRELYRYSCGFCGQEELHDRRGDVVCSNCGEAMHSMSDDVCSAVDAPAVVDAKADGAVEAAANGTCAEDGTKRKRRGRPPKASGGSCPSCSNCANAMRAISGYTCKVSLGSRPLDSKAEEGCGYVEGEPVGTGRRCYI